MQILPTTLSGILIIEPAVFTDNRGFFVETYSRNRYRDAGLEMDFVQDNLSYSVQNTLRGLHYQVTRPQAKLVQVLAGEIYDVVVDLRPWSETFTQWNGFHLSSENKKQLFISKGFAHGFCVLSESALFMYKCSDFYDRDDEGGILWNDQDLAIDWPVTDPVVSGKDSKLPILSALAPDRLPARESCS